MSKTKIAPVRAVQRAEITIALAGMGPLTKADRPAIARAQRILRAHHAALDEAAEQALSRLASASSRDRATARRGR